MESCDYTQININENVESYSFTLKLFLRQMFVSSGIWMIYFMLGLCVGAPTVYIPQIRKEVNSAFIISDEMASWLSSMVCYSGLPWSFILPVIMIRAGRKCTFILINISTAIGGIVFYCSSSAIEMLASTCFFGISLSAAHTILPVFINEYSLHLYRGPFLTFKSMCLYLGIWVSNAIGTFFHWRNIGIVSMACSVYVLVSAIFWPESPHYLSTKKKIDKCITTQRWLKGYNKESENELQVLLDMQNDEQNFENNIRFKFLLKLFRILRSKEFYKPVLLTVTLLILHYASGKLVCTVYAVDIIKKITNSEEMAYRGMLILDGVVILAMIIGSCLSKIFKRRTQLFSASLLGAVFLFIISLYLFLIKDNMLKENNIVSIILLTFYQLGISCGPVILCSSIFGEMVPKKYMSYVICITSFICVSIQAISLKVAPYIFKKLGLHGTFLFYGSMVCICVYILYIHLPETKDKTIQEIQNHFSKSYKVEKVTEKSKESKNINDPSNSDQY